MTNNIRIVFLRTVTLALALKYQIPKSKVHDSHPVTSCSNSLGLSYLNKYYVIKIGICIVQHCSFKLNHSYILCPAHTLNPLGCMKIF